MVRLGELDGTIKPSVPYIELSVSTPSSAVKVGWNDLKWAIVDIGTPDFELRTTGIIDVYTTGLYRVDLEVGFKFPDNAANSVVQLRILKNGIEVPSTRSIGKVIVATAVTDYLQLTVSKTIYLKINDNISFQFATTDLTLAIADDTGSKIYYCRARVAYIPMGGWNNNTGGSIINRGVRR
jgi:hypothetical protein